jgi:hypothetical protein
MFVAESAKRDLIALTLKPEAEARAALHVMKIKKVQP